MKFKFCKKCGQMTMFKSVNENVPTQQTKQKQTKPSDRQKQIQKTICKCIVCGREE